MAAFFNQLWSKLTGMILPKLGGIGGFVASKILNYGGQWLYSLLENMVKNMQRNAAQDKAKKNYDAVDKNPDLKVEDRAKAYEDYINSGN